jgi:hypothetical protein
MEPPENKEKKEKKQKDAEREPWRHDSQQKLDLCLTCGLEGHSWTVCTNRCDKCSNMHTSSICPVLPALYPRSSNYKKEDALGRIQTATDDVERLVHQRERELAVLEVTESLVLARKEPALAAAKPTTNSQKGLALRLLDVGGCVELDPGWTSRSAKEKELLRAQWNAEACGVLPCAEDSLLRQAMIARKASFYTLS